MTELYRRKVVGAPDFDGDKEGATLSYEYERDERTEKWVGLAENVARVVAAWAADRGMPGEPIDALLRKAKSLQTAESPDWPLAWLLERIAAELKEVKPPEPERKCGDCCTACGYRSTGREDFAAICRGYRKRQSKIPCDDCDRGCRDDPGHRKSAEEGGCSGFVPRQPKPVNCRCRVVPIVATVDASRIWRPKKQIRRLK